MRNDSLRGWFILLCENERRPGQDFMPPTSSFRRPNCFLWCEPRKWRASTAACQSDHFRPWASAQGRSGFAWSWLGAALQATSLPFGVISAPGYRYHPAIIAQGAATLAEMFPGRFWLWTGKRSAAEDITGLPWPEEVERNARLSECASTVAALLRGETVSHSGRVTA
jgi:coenzyme F420-dependent glucose-6-phosphate dehydrogenase